LWYAAYNIILSLIWGNNSPSAIVASLSYLSKAMQLTNWLYSLGHKAMAATSISMPPKQVLLVKILCALQGAVAGTVVISNMIALMSLWQRARVDHAKRIQLGQEQSQSNYWDPSSGSLDETGCIIRLVGVHSDLTELLLHRRGEYGQCLKMSLPSNI
jgi:type IV secretory pathway VirB2 component (pilin)